MDSSGDIGLDGMVRARSGSTSEARRHREHDWSGLDKEVRGVGKFCFMPSGIEVGSDANGHPSLPGVPLVVKSCSGELNA